MNGQSQHDRGREAHKANLHVVPADAKNECRGKKGCADNDTRELPPSPDTVLNEAHEVPVAFVSHFSILLTFAHSANSKIMFIVTWGAGAISWTIPSLSIRK